MNKQEKMIRVHEYWMSFRRDYHKVKEGHRPKITHEEVEEMIYQILKLNNLKERLGLKNPELITKEAQA